jgi:tetratricopeptide (TPR) repeat protein
VIIKRALQNRSSVVASVVFWAGCALVAGLFTWMAAVSTTELTGWSAADNHYNLLVAGFRQGHLSLNKEAPAELGQLPDPYDPVTNARYRLGAGLHDMSYYRGTLYLYFGVTPALLLFWPWVALTGHYLFHHHAVAIFCAVGFLASAGVLRAMWRRYFAEVGVGVVAAGVLALGLAAGVPVLLQRAEFWEVAVSCGYALSMLALAAVWGALHDPARRGWWLAAASLSLGLAVGARPFLLLGAAILLVPVGLAWSQPAATGRRRLPWGMLAAALLPLVLCGLALMLYNHLRFDSPFEFGQRYQLAGDRQDTARHFSLDYLWFNFCVYFLEPVRWSRQFPFVGAIATPVLPSGHAPVEDPFGVLTNIPVLWFALAAPLAWRRRTGEARSILRGFISAVAIFFGICAVVLLLFYGNCSRYEVEFLTTLVFLAVVGILGVERALAGRPRWRLAARLFWGLLLAFSIGFNLLDGFDHYAVERCRLGNQLGEAGRIAEAIAQCEASLRVKPAYVEGHSSLGNALRQAGRIPEAIKECEEALRLDPDYARAHNNLGNALLDAGRIPEALAHYHEALKLKPDDAKMHYNLGNAWLQADRISDAISEYETALRLDPDDAKAYYNLGNARFGTGRIPEAIAQYDAALRVKPDYVEARNNLGNALLQMERVPEAIAQLEAAVQIRPDYAEARNSLGAALYHAGRVPEAITQFAAALRIKPDYEEARKNLERTLRRLPATIEKR